MRALRSTVLIAIVWASAGVNAFAQPQLVFTAPAPEKTSTETTAQTFTAIEDRGLALWSGAASDFGAGAALSSPRWTVRSITSMTALSVVGHQRPIFQQVEVIRPVLAMGSLSVAGGGGVRQEWDGTQVLIGRVLAGSRLGRGRIQGNLVMERAFSSPRARDAADVVTSVGWTQRIARGVSVGVEGVGQDLEGLWNPAEADGGARLLAGPSLHTESASGKWIASFIAGPVLQTLSTVPTTAVASPAQRSGGRHFGMFASATWVPSPHR